MTSAQEKKSRRNWFTIGIAVSLSAATFASPLGSKKYPWRADEDAAQLGPMVTNFYSLPHSGQVANAPWAGPWWKTFWGGIAQRWPNAIRPGTWETYEPYSMDELASMSDDQIENELSAPEKLDVISGNTARGSSNYYKNLYSVRGWVRSEITDNPNQGSFHGLCNGWANAALVLPEPAAITVAVPYGNKKINVRFRSGDLKALATYYYAGKTKSASQGYYQGFLNSMRENQSPNPNSLTMLNAGAFHIAIENIVGKQHEGLVVDTSLGPEVWNFPIIRYTSKYYKEVAVFTPGHHPDAASEVEVETWVDYRSEAGPDVVQTSGYVTQKYYHYYLELSADKKILGGTYISDSNYPDFAWKIKGKIPYEGDYKVLDQLWRPIQ